MQYRELFCEICETAHIVTTEKKKDLFYCCNICRGFEEENNVIIRENNFDETKVIEFNS